MAMKLKEDVSATKNMVKLRDDSAVGGSSDGARDAQMTQGVDLAHGNVSEAIASGESMRGDNNPYATFNYYKSEGGLGSSYFGMIDGKPIDQMSFEQLENLSQEGSTLNISYTDGDKPCTRTGRLYATGKYQMVPKTREYARGYVGLKKSDIYSPANQDLCFTNCLITDKRPEVMAYFKGEGTVEAAALAIAQEWAAVGIKPGRVNSQKRIAGDDGLTGYYDGDGVNKASVSYERIIAALEADKAAIEAGGIATRTVDSTAGTPTSVIPVDNAVQNNDVGSANAQEEAAGESSGGNVSVDLDTAVAANKSYEYSKETWKEIQRAVGLTGSDVDGIVGKVTSQAIANWQANNGFTGKDVDGICGPKTLAAIRGGSSQSGETGGDVQKEEPAKEEPAKEEPAKEEPVKEEPVKEEPAAIEVTDIDSAVKANKALGYSKNLWKKIQSGVGLSGGNVDGSVGPTTTKKIADWQKAHGYSDSNANGVCGEDTLAALNLTHDASASKLPNDGNGFMKADKVDLDALINDASKKGYDVSQTDQAARYIAKYGTVNDSLHQCTRGTAMFLQLASRAKGKADRWYQGACAACYFGNGSSNANISSSVSAEYAESTYTDALGNTCDVDYDVDDLDGAKDATQVSSSDDKKYKRIFKNKGDYYAFSKVIEGKIKEDGEYVTFKYTKSNGAMSFHIVFRADGKYYSDYKQNSAAGCGHKESKFWYIHFYNR